MNFKIETEIRTTTLTNHIPIEVYAWGIRVAPHQNRWGRKSFLTKDLGYNVKEGKLERGRMVAQIAVASDRYTVHRDAADIEEKIFEAVCHWWCTQPRWLAIQMQRHQLGQQIEKLQDEVRGHEQKARDCLNTIEHLTQLMTNLYNQEIALREAEKL